MAHGLQGLVGPRPGCSLCVCVYVCMWGCGCMHMCAHVCASPLNVEGSCLGAGNELPFNTSVFHPPATGMSVLDLVSPAQTGPACAPEADAGCQKDPYGVTSVLVCVFVCVCVSGWGKTLVSGPTLTRFCQLASWHLIGPLGGGTSWIWEGHGGQHFSPSVALAAKAAVFEGDCTTPREARGAGGEADIMEHAWSGSGCCLTCGGRTR